jgi:hypothetical protein
MNPGTDLNVAGQEKNVMRSFLVAPAQLVLPIQMEGDCVFHHFKEDFFIFFLKNYFVLSLTILKIN